MASLRDERSFVCNEFLFFHCSFDCFPCLFPGKADNCAGEMKHHGCRSAEVRQKVKACACSGGVLGCPCSRAGAFGFPVTLVSWCRSCGTGRPAGISVPRAGAAAGATGCPLLWAGQTLACTACAETPRPPCLHWLPGLPFTSRQWRARRLRSPPHSFVCLLLTR